MAAVDVTAPDAIWPALVAALLPLGEPPRGPAWNRREMHDVLGDTPRRSAAVLLGVRDVEEPRLILTVRMAHLLTHAGQVAFPGGSADPGDTDAVATALRESEEEIGLAPALVTPLGYLEPFETISGYCITPVVARVDRRAALIAAPDEVAEVFEVPMAFLREPANLRRYRMDYRGRSRPMVEFLYHGHRIWGATAAMLMNLLQRMDRP